MTHRKAPATLLTLFLSPMLLLAQPPRKSPDFDAGWRSEARQEQRIQKMIELLDLSEAQVLELESILDAHRQARQEAFAGIREVQDNLQTLLESAEPNPTDVGAKAIQLHQLRKSAHAQAEQQVVAVRQVLTPEQAEKFDTMLEVREMGRDRGERHPGARRGRRGQRSTAPNPNG
jgi:Spy/CpxP family protein refolding chaperone